MQERRELELGHRSARVEAAGRPAQVQQPVKLVLVFDRRKRHAAALPQVEGGLRRPDSRRSWRARAVASLRGHPRAVPTGADEERSRSRMPAESAQLSVAATEVLERLS